MNPLEVIGSAHDYAQTHGTDPWHGLMHTLLVQLRGHPDIPLEVREALDVAEKYWGGHSGSRDDLAHAKASVWDYLRGLPAGEDAVTTSGRLARAVLCVLEPDGDDETISMSAEWFVAMVGGTR